MEKALAHINQIIRDMKYTGQFKEFVIIAINIISESGVIEVKDKGFGVINLKAEISENPRVDNEYGNKELDIETGNLDIWVTGCILGENEFYELRFYLSDVWVIPGYDAKEVVEHIDIARYERTLRDIDFKESDCYLHQINELLEEFINLCYAIREKYGDDDVCGLCEYNGAYIGENGDWCNECPGFDSDECFCLSEEFKNKYSLLTD